MSVTGSSRTHDVVVIGAGPSGSVLGYELAKVGLDVVILEKERIPRYKTCGGGVNVRTARLLDFDISSVTERTVTNGEVTYKLGSGFIKRYPEPLTYMVMRDRFDQYLAEKAADAGTAVVDGHKVTNIERVNGHFSVTCQKEEFSGRIIVGADGANSVVARKLGLMKGAGLSVGLEAEVKVPARVLERWKSMVTIDVGVIPAGYGWVFPKGNHLSIGVVGDVRHSEKLRGYFERFVVGQKLGDYKVLKFKGHKLPMRRPGMTIQKGRGLLVGDAAGLIDPFSGDGIYYAIRSAQMAAPAVVEELNSDEDGLSGYQRSVDDELMPDRQASATMLRLFSWAPGLYFRWLKHHDVPWRAACMIVRGDKRYTSVRERLGPIGPLFDMVRGL